jgi:hypothetical protein
MTLPDDLMSATEILQCWCFDALWALSLVSMLSPVFHNSLCYPCNFTFLIASQSESLLLMGDSSQILVFVCLGSDSTTPVHSHGVSVFLSS